MTAVDRVANLAAGPHLRADPFRRPTDDRSRVVAPGHARQGRALHHPFDVLDVAGADRAGGDLDDRGLRIRLGIVQFDQAQI
jgi:hypothetical protein